MKRFLAVVFLSIGSLSACGGGGDEVWDSSAIVEALGAKDDGSGTETYVFTVDGVECDIPVVLTTKGAVDLYAEAGDVVAKNPSGTAGVKIIAGESATCKAAAEELLASLK